jgi:PhnB protein
MAVRPVPADYPGVSVYLNVHDAAAALEFYGKAVGARERMRIPAYGGKIGHAELELAGSVVMLADEFAELSEVGNCSPRALQGTSFTLLFYVPDVDAAVQRALAAGAKLQRPVKNHYYGDRSGTLLDPFGHQWTLATRLEDLTRQEIAQRAAGLQSALTQLLQ